MVFDRIGRIKASDPWKDQNIKDVIWGGGGYIYTDPQLTVKAYPHTMVWVPIGCSQGLWVDGAR